MPKADQMPPDGTNSFRASIASVVAGAPRAMPRHSWNQGGTSNKPRRSKSAASMAWPRSKISNSGITPASRIISAIAARWAGVFTKTVGPKFIVAMSSEQISGRDSSTWATRSSGVPMPLAEMRQTLIRIVRTATPEVDRREQERHPASGSLRLRIGNSAPASCELLNVSAGGFAVRGSALVGQEISGDIAGRPLCGRVMNVADGAVRVQLIEVDAALRDALLATARAA